jgi:hypothetical protein
MSSSGLNAERLKPDEDIGLHLLACTGANRRNIESAEHSQLPITPNRMPRALLPLLVFALMGGVGMLAGTPEKDRAKPAGKSTARAATPDELAMLNDLLHRTAGDFHRWAYTEHRVMRDEKGKVKSEVLLRYDPSKPYAEQWTPIKIDGKDPSDREREKYRRRGEKSASAQIPMKPDPDNRRRRSLGELIDVTKSSIASESVTHLTFEVPLLKVGNERFPPDKFLVLARVRKEGARLENVSVRLREGFRSKLVVKVKSGEGSLDFAVIDPKYPATLVAIEGDAQASVLFVNIGGSMQLKRTELKHVKPFDERFDVQIGNLKAIDF